MRNSHGRAWDSDLYLGFAHPFGKEMVMGWGPMLFMGNFGQQLDIEELRRSFEQQDERDRTQEQSIVTLTRETRDLKLAVTALSRLLVSKGVLAPDEVEQIGRAIER